MQKFSLSATFFGFSKNFLKIVIFDLKINGTRYQYSSGFSHLFYRKIRSKNTVNFPKNENLFTELQINFQLCIKSA
ncbi:MAG: hypothetical protein BHW53_04730 [Ruminococcus sp. CAG:108-related_41_35]|nr:MAG: hypothetical protein BHW53_04730 [Ruminococcus sp. CAG:108-related_41_35]